jgi:hypothetical protein
MEIIVYLYFKRTESATGYVSGKNIGSMDAQSRFHISSLAIDKYIDILKDARPA